jgi:hypothetical protein
MNHSTLRLQLTGRILFTSLFLILTIAQARDANADEVSKVRRPIRFAETEFGRSLEAASGGLSLPFEKSVTVTPLTVQLRLRMVPRSARFRSAILAATDQNRPVFQIIQDGRNGLAIECPAAGKMIHAGLDLADDKWHDLAVVFGSKTIRIVVDGRELKNQKVDWAKKLSVLKTAWIGQSPDGKQRFDGLIDDVLITPGVSDINNWKANGKQVVAVNFDETEADYLAQWTPLRSTRPDAEPWENETDDDWTDGRFQDMEKGPVLACSTKLPGHYAGVKNLSIRFGNGPNRGNSKGPMLMFDTERCVLTAARNNAWLKTSPARFGILRMPELMGDDVLYVDARQAIKYEGQDGSPRVRFGGWWNAETGPILEYSIDGVTLVEQPDFQVVGNSAVVTRRIAGLKKKRLARPVRIALATIADAKWETKNDGVVIARTATASYSFESNARLNRKGNTIACVLDDVTQANIRIERSSATAALPTQKLDAKAASLVQLVNSKPRAKRQAPLITKLVEGQRKEGSPFVVDRFTLPVKNDGQSLFFVTGVDKHRDSISICTVHGEVWLVDGANRVDKKLTWRRFATGLYQPLGLRTNAADHSIDVLCRDQVTRLYDYNNDGRADYYQNFNNDLVITGTAHAYATCLERDPSGNYYFFKSGRSLPHGGKLMKLSADGKTLAPFASGYRHPIGLGVSPTGMVTAADNQGNWIPSSSIQVVQPGSFHGYMPEIHRPKNPKTFDQPMCWLPWHVDSSSGGQIWVPDGVWGSLSKRMLHLSWGRCTIHLVMPQKVGNLWQGGTIKLPHLKFSSGPIVGRFIDDQLFVVGLDGWQTAAALDGCLERVRYVGGDSLIPLDLSAQKDGLRIRFSKPLDAKKTKLANFDVTQWNYKWTSDYGSPDYSVAEPNRVGQDKVIVSDIQLSEDRRSVFLSIPQIQPVMQMEIRMKLFAEGSGPVERVIYNTIHTAP